MPEELHGGGAEISTVELPSALRIRQRLGQISTEQTFKRNLVPQIEALGKLSMAPDELIASLESRLSDYAEEHVIGMVPFVLDSMMPKIIDSLVDDEQQKQSAFQAWESRVVELKGNSLQTSQHIMHRYRNADRKLPRKKKKAQQQRGYLVPGAITPRRHPTTR